MPYVISSVYFIIRKKTCSFAKSNIATEMILVNFLE